MSVYTSPINSRYKAPITSFIWSSDNKILTMRRLWIDLARFQKKLGLACLTDEGIGEMERALETIDYQKINEYESRFHHDIMAHIHAFSDLCPTGKNMLHLGAFTTGATNYGGKTVRHVECRYRDGFGHCNGYDSKTSVSRY